MTSTPEQVIAKIREALEAGPTSGAWQVDQDRDRPQIFHVVGDSEVVCGLDGICSPHRGNDRTFREDEANIRFIAACNPQNIAALLAERDALRKALTDVRGSIKNARGAVESNQVVDKDVHGTLSRAIRMIDAALQSAADTPAPPRQMVGIRLRTDNHKHYGQDIVVSMRLEDGREVELIRSFGALPDITIDHFITEIGIACCTSATATEDGR